MDDKFEPVVVMSDGKFTIPEVVAGDERVPVAFVIFFWYLMSERPGQTIQHLNIRIYSDVMRISVCLRGDPYSYSEEEYAVSLDGRDIRLVRPV